LSNSTLLAGQAFDAQAHVLGILLSYPETVGEALLSVGDSDFTQGEYRLIYQAIRSLYNAGQPISGLTVNDALGGDNRELLAGLITVAPTAANLSAYVEMMKRASLQMRLAEVGARMEAAESLDAQFALLEEMQGMTCSRPSVKITTMSQAYQEFLDRNAEGETPPYLTWGISQLDEKIHVEAGDFVVLGGYPSAGKTALALQFVRHIAKSKQVGYFYLENNDKKLFDRLVSAAALVSFGRVKTHALTEEDFRSIISMQQSLTSPQLEMVAASGMTVSDIRSVALSRRYDLIVVDYLQKIRGDRSRKNLGDFERVSQISDELQQLGQQTKICVLALSQLSRPDTRNGKTSAPTMASLRQSGQIEQDADVVMLLYMEDESQPKLRTLKLAKNKEGESNIAMRMVFDGDTQTFSRVSPQQTYEPKQRGGAQINFWEGWSEVEDSADNPFTAPGEGSA